MPVSAVVPVPTPRRKTPLVAAAPAVPIRIGLFGVGHVGQAVVRVAQAERGHLRSRGLDLQFVGGLVRDPSRPRDAAGVPVTADPARVFDAAPDVIVEALGGAEPARGLVVEALARGIAVVSANKTLMARHGTELAAAAGRAGGRFAYEAAVVAGVPFVGALSRRPLLARWRRLAGILNGTSNFLLTDVARGRSFADALETAVARGFAEPDAAADISGRDAAEKLTILLRLAGHEVQPDALPTCALAEIDRTDLAWAAALGGTVKPVAIAAVAPDHTAWVGPAFVTADHPFARVDGATNTLALTAANGEVVSFTGPGAGPEVTAATLLDDLVEIVRLPREHAAAASAGEVEAFTPTAPSGCWFITVTGEALRPFDLAEYLFTHGLPPRRVETAADAVAALTWPASWASVQYALGPLRALGLRVIAVPVLDGDVRG